MQQSTTLDRPLADLVLRMFGPDGTTSDPDLRDRTVGIIRSTPDNDLARAALTDLAVNQ